MAKRRERERERESKEDRPSSHFALSRAMPRDFSRSERRKRFPRQRRGTAKGVEEDRGKEERARESI